MSYLTVSNPIPVFYWSSKSFISPSSFNPVGNYTRGCSKFFSPSRNTFCNAVKSCVNIRFYVALLFGYCRPSTVFRKISKAAIYSVDRCFSWLIPHISKEIFKHKPSFADSYSNTAVSSIVMGSFFRTSANHAYPRSVCGSMSVVSTMSVPCRSNACATRSTTVLTSPFSTWASRHGKFYTAIRTFTILRRVFFHSFLSISRWRKIYKKLPGLVRRREAERVLFNGDKVA